MPRWCLYGSTARGERQPDSDYDLLVLTKRKLSHQEERMLHDAVYDVELRNDAVLSLVIYAREEWDHPRLALRCTTET